MKGLMAILAVVAIAGFAITKYGFSGASDAAKDFIEGKTGDSGEEQAADEEQPETPEPTPAPTPAPVKQATPDEIIARFIATKPMDLTDEKIIEASNLSPANEAVTSIKIGGARVSPVGIGALAKFPNLEMLDLSSVRVSLDYFKAIQTVRQLKGLNLENTLTDDTVIPAIAVLSELRELNLSETRVTDNGIAQLASIPQLEVLKLRKTLTKGAAFKVLKVGALRHLEVGRTGFGNQGNPFVKKMKSLRVLRAGNCGVNNETLKSIGQCRELEELYIANSAINDVGMKFLRSLTNLKKLSLTNNKFVTGNGLGVLRKMEGLEMLDINGTGANEATKNDLVKLFPACDIMWNGQVW